jgi:hypothetical protein
MAMVLGLGVLQIYLTHVLKSTSSGMKFKALCCGLLGWIAVSLAQQVQLADVGELQSNLDRQNTTYQMRLGSVQSSYDHGLFTPIEDLSVLSETTFTTLRHPIFPKYSVRIKKSSFCHEAVKCVILKVTKKPLRMNASKGLIQDI